MEEKHPSRVKNRELCGILTYPNPITLPQACPRPVVALKINPILGAGVDRADLIPKQLSLFDLCGGSLKDLTQKPYIYWSPSAKTVPREGMYLSHSCLRQEIIVEVNKKLARKLKRKKSN